MSKVVSKYSVGKMEAKMNVFTGGFLVLICLCQFTASLEVDLTIEIAPGTQECFHEEFLKETSLDVEYQSKLSREACRLKQVSMMGIDVTQGGDFVINARVQVIDGGDLDIDFHIRGPNGQVLVAESRKQDSLHKVEVKVLGTYSFCFDNTFSRMSRKVVFFEIISDDDDDEDEWKPDKEEIKDLMDMTIDEFKVSVDSVKHNLDRSIQLQNMLRAHEARDRNVQEGNFDRVNTFSCIQLVIMIGVGLLQVVLIRSLFDDKSRISRIFKQKT